MRKKNSNYSRRTSEYINRNYNQIFITKISYNNLDIIFVTDPTLLKMIEKQMKIKLKINI